MVTGFLRSQSSKAPIYIAAIVCFLVFGSLWIHRDRLQEEKWAHPNAYVAPAPAKLKTDKRPPPKTDDFRVEVEKPSTEEPKGPKYAFATLLSGPSGDEDWAHDNYLTGTRLLAYQLLHSPQTRSKKNIPFVVFVGQNISEAKRERLRKDGAVIKEVAPIHADWVKPAQKGYSEVLSKLHLWEHTEYDRICLLDGDIVLNKPLDGIFDDPAVALQTTGGNRSAEVYKEDEGQLPTTYAFAAAMEVAPEHNYPPQRGQGDYVRDDNLNAGFMVFRPDKELFDHYMKILAQPDRFDSALPEQSLLNYAHRWSGNMPWKPIGNTWNVNFPFNRDIEAGVASVHEKFWAPWHGEVKPWLEAWRYRMEGFFEAMDEMR